MLLKEAVAKRIRELIKENNLNQYKLSKLSGVAESTISTILNADTKTIKLSTIYELCAGLGIELHEFFNCNYLNLENLDD